MRIIPLLLLIILSYERAAAQQITGFTNDDQGKPLAGASVSLKKNKDSSLVKLSISDANGQYEFSAVSPGEYFIFISHIGYIPRSSAVFEVRTEGIIHAPAAPLSHASRELREAVVAGRRPLLEVKSDKLILNVEGNINSVGEDALELLRKAPGVVIDKDNTISANGKNGVQIYVDGRPTYLSGNSLADYLKNLQSSSVESIEIISNPGSRYDAAGNAGIINIRLKKNKAFGTNATLSGGYNISTYAKYNGAASFNYRNKDINIFGDYSYRHSINETYATMERRQLDTFFLQRTNLITTSNSHNYKAGFDYSLDSRNSIGVVVNGSIADNGIQTTSATPIVYIPTNATARILQANGRTDGHNNNFNANINYRYADSSGHQLGFDADYGLYRLRSDQYQPNDYFDSVGKHLYSNNYEILSPTDIHIYSLKGDYEQNFLKGRLGFGAKSSYVTSGNDFREFDVNGQQKMLDTLRSNYFDYKENINALYASYNRTLKGWIIQGGLRAENTNSKGRSTGYKPAVGVSTFQTYDSAFTRHYTDLFPSASITYNKDPMRQWTLNYSRRIDRPAYQDLNPFEFKIDDYTFAKGNTLLRPQYTHSVGLTFTYAYKLTAVLNYSHVKDLSTTLVDTTEASKAVISRKNLATQDITSLNISYPFEYKWYSAFLNVTGFYSVNKANFGAGRVINLNVFNTTIYTQHSFRLGGGWTGQLTQYYVSPNIWQATLQARSMWNLDAGLQKTLFKGNATAKISVTDIFNTLHWTATSNFAGQYIRTTGGYESRQLKLYFSYRLGNKQVKAARRHQSGAEDEKQRVSGASQ
ncbi:MAG: TonB-dependent receptor [Bacteroidetes bacterium]|nr:TonB-dependent receptor [Bacteroidota bacterium]